MDPAETNCRGWQIASTNADEPSLAWFGLDRLDPIDGGPVSPLNGFLAGILLAFDPLKAAEVNATYRVEIDGRLF